ncbi:endonuclease III [Tetragenococcus koreensis]|uniref:endonuclease III n=1 Tax=Tetragenococcus koreensis TaxID=290335 RepID=UPI001F1BE79E|nr:endonuclease III [Tetragenococcus koreensis]MCF1584071.1 endonuclease III [Tetragenococcus koreensis]MCF1613532.1 endonuclease III [Tetragenococcus koreensis]MCF1618013.1 endonuclease III [Tetragenococcus koreensis]MCF1618729.1 endonuclease III [Tetragenococcus koreensis]MCF1622838.1 endonuclease III [Tetragenococcus koreensis]
MSGEILLNDKELTEAVQAIIKLYPKKGTELNYETNFQLLCAVILSAQTTDISVNKATPKLFENFPTPEKMADASLEDIQKNIRSIGLSNNKAKFLKNMSNALLEKFEGQVPANREDLISLPGVGRKTANVVLTNGFNIPAFAVDTHVNRVTKKLHFVFPDASVEEIEKIISEKLPEEMWYPAHHSILLFGRYQCVARKHDHNECLKRIKEKMPKNEIAETAFEKMSMGETDRSTTSI